MESLQAFLSYVREDDISENNRITALGKQIQSEYQLLTGNKIEMFIDTKLNWGDDWKRKIEESLSNVVYFIAVVTPNYLKSPNCREEVQFFVEMAKQLGNIELFMPILYVNIPNLEDEQEHDDIVELIRKYNYEDWREMRLKDFSSESYRTAINRLANQLIEANKKIDHTIPKEVKEVDKVITPEKTEDRDLIEELGTIEKMALYEEEFPRLGETITEIATEISMIGEIGTRKTEEISNLIPPPNYSQRAQILKETAVEFWGPTKKIKKLVNSFTTQINHVDSGFRILMEEMPIRANEGEIDKENIDNFFLQAEELCNASSTSKKSLLKMIESIKPLEKLSRDMRLVIRAMAEELTILIQTLELIDNWKELIIIGKQKIHF